MHRRHLLQAALLTSAARSDPRWIFDRSAGPPQTAQLGWLNVRAFGARGDGQSDDTRALQAAVSAAGRGGGNVVVVPPGRYPLSATLEVNRSGVQLIGCGAASRIIQTRDRAHGVRITAPHCGLSDVSLEGTGVGVADGSGGSGIIFTAGGDRGFARNVECTNFGTAAFDSHNVQYTRFLDCDARCNRGDNSMGFWIRHDTEPTYALVANVRAADALFEGIQLETCQRASVTNFLVERCGVGVALTSGTLSSCDNKLTNGEVVGASAAGVYLHGAPGRPVERNTLASVTVRSTGTDHALHHGVLVDSHAPRNVFLGLHVVLSASRGLQDDGLANTYESCLFEANGDNGVVLRATSDTRLVACTVSRNQGHGLLLEGSPRRAQIVGLVAEGNARSGALGAVRGGRIGLYGEGNVAGLNLTSGWDFAEAQA